MTECAGVQRLPPLLRHMGGETWEGDTVLDCPLQGEKVGGGRTGAGGCRGSRWKIPVTRGFYCLMLQKQQETS